MHFHLLCREDACQEINEVYCEVFALNDACIVFISDYAFIPVVPNLTLRSVRHCSDTL